MCAQKECGIKKKKLKRKKKSHLSGCPVLGGRIRGFRGFLISSVFPVFPTGFFPKGTVLHDRSPVCMLSRECLKSTLP